LAISKTGLLNYQLVYQLVLKDEGFD